ncbi:unnamed protein product [Paramecium octaurelia]|uniref:Uncharacterized protein n=1 Tax=Paramecium octaurelia TaxID=43137 RepID=A0A8S1SJ87_PAROT|nr:unnamed protein product [Paramecium octaurelia]
MSFVSVIEKRIKKLQNFLKKAFLNHSNQIIKNVYYRHLIRDLNYEGKRYNSVILRKTFKMWKIIYSQINIFYNCSKYYIHEIIIDKELENRTNSNKLFGRCGSREQYINLINIQTRMKLFYFLQQTRNGKLLMSPGPNTFDYSLMKENAYLVKLGQGCQNQTFRLLKTTQMWQSIQNSLLRIAL